VRYLLLIANVENGNAAPPSPEVMEAWQRYMGDLNATGKLLASERLRPSTTATTVRQSNGQTLLSDGPFTESKEQLGGFFLIEAEHLDEAVALASRLPTLARGGSVEIRPVWEQGGA
jgi:hypothetical protein